MDKNICSDIAQTKRAMSGCQTIRSCSFSLQPMANGKAKIKEMEKNPTEIKV